jgi:hypothetical protein
LLSFLEDVLRKSGVAKKIQYMKPLSLPDEEGVVKPEGIEIKLEGVNTRELITFLHRIEQSGKLTDIQRIKIQRASKARSASLKVTLQVYAYTLTERKRTIPRGQNPSASKQRRGFKG